MTVDQGWRGFINGSNHILLAKTIQDVTDQFLDSMWKQQFLVEDIFKKNDYQTYMNTTDLSKINPLFSMPIKFRFGTANLINFLYHFRKKNPDAYKKYQDTNDPLFITMDKHAAFFRSAKSLITVRNKDAHDKNPINTTGWSLLAAGHVMTIVELMPSLQQRKEFLPLRENLLNLLAEIVELERGGDFEDEEPISGAPEASETIKDIGVPSEYFEEKLKDLSESLNVKVSNDFNSLNQKVDALPDLLSSSIADKIKDLLPLERQVSNELLIEEPRDSLRVFNPTTDEPTTEEESEFVGEWIAQKIKEENEALELEELQPISYLTPSAADREMLVLQKQIRKETKCENWENIAQGPIRMQILTNNINTLKEYIANDAIGIKFEKHEKIMQEQIDSDLGFKFFQLLERITWD